LQARLHEKEDAAFLQFLGNDAGISQENELMMEESRLVRRAQAGDRMAFALLLRPYIRLSYHVALRITGNQEDAEDASQQTLLKAFTRIKQFNGDSQFSTWLTRIAINEALMKLRKRRSEEAHLLHPSGTEQDSDPLDAVPASDDVQPEKMYLKRESQLMVRELIRELPHMSQAVVWLLGIQERKIKEAAEILDLSESAVKSRFMRARQQLRQTLAHQA